MVPKSDNNILIVSDRADLADETASELQTLGFSGVVSPGIQEALSLAEERSISVVLIISVSSQSTARVYCSTIRTASAVPIMALCYRAGEHDVAGLLAAGADDCVRPSIGRVELAARIRSLIRRAATPSYQAGAASVACEREPGSAIHVGGVGLDLTTCRVCVSGRTSTLTPNEFRLMAVFMGAPGDVFSREDLRRRVWPNDRHSLHLIEVHIANLRSKIEVNPHRPAHIVTVRSRGYKFAGMP
jgi:two-component system response regulator RegX3